MHVATPFIAPYQGAGGYAAELRDDEPIYFSVTHLFIRTV